MMKRRWDFRPPEFIALPPAERKRVWHHCYWRALRRPRFIIPIIVLGVSFTLLMALSQQITGSTQSAWGSIGRFGIIVIGQMAFILVFAKYAVYVLRDELRLCAIGCCLNCWYDLTGNVSGVCPECGKARTATQSGNDQERGYPSDRARPVEDLH